MEKIIDEVFGELDFDYAWKKDHEQTIFSKTVIVEIIVEGNDEDELIRDEQRTSYREFISHNSDIISRVEEAVFEYYQEVCDDKGLPLIERADLVNKVELTGIVFPMVLDDGDISVGFLLEAECDPEHGIGVKITNGEIEASTQDLIA
jgi:hypothetical protein